MKSCLLLGILFVTIENQFPDIHTAIPELIGTSIILRESHNHVTQSPTTCPHPLGISKLHQSRTVILTPSHLPPKSHLPNLPVLQTHKINNTAAKLSYCFQPYLCARNAESRGGDQIPRHSIPFRRNTPNLGITYIYVHTCADTQGPDLFSL